MLLLGVVTVVAGDQKVDLAGLAFVVAQALGFVALIAIVGTRMMRRSSPLLDAPINPLSPLTICLALCLGLAAAAANLGLAAIIGAFLAGMVAAESRQRHVLERQVGTLMAFIVPFFFVVTGAKVVLKELASPAALGMLLVVTVLAIVGKVAGGMLGAASLGRRSALIVGVGMAPRGEVGIIIASLGEKAGIFGPQIYAVIIGMSLLTSVLAPPVLKVLLAGSPPSEPEEEQSSILLTVEETGH
jgi:Kef-type K+ transport system membrane component KefB